jgi:hypothetical protein
VSTRDTCRHVLQRFLALARRDDDFFDRALGKYHARRSRGRGDCGGNCQRQRFVSALIHAFSPSMVSRLVTGLTVAPSSPDKFGAPGLRAIYRKYKNATI